MKNGKRVKSIVCGLVTMLLICSIILAFSAKSVTAAEKKPIVLKVVSFLPKTERTNAGMWRLIEAVNTRAKGELTIEWVGGPESIPGYDQFDAVKTGAVSMTHTTPNYYSRIVGCTKYVNYGITPMVQREYGIFDIYQEAHMTEGGVYYLSNLCHGTEISLFSNVLINSLDDFKGRTFRAPPSVLPLYKELGISAVTMPMGEVFIAVERGVVEGYTYPVTSILAASLEEITKYQIDPVQGGGWTALLINKKVWNGLPKHLQDLLIEEGKKIEPWQCNYFRNACTEDRAAMRKAGVKLIKLPPKDAERFVALNDELKYQTALKLDPIRTPKIKKLFDKAIADGKGVPWTTPE